MIPAKVACVSAVRMKNIPKDLADRLRLGRFGPSTPADLDKKRRSWRNESAKAEMPSELHCKSATNGGTPMPYSKLEATLKTLLSILLGLRDHSRPRFRCRRAWMMSAVVYIDSQVFSTSNMV